MNISVTELPLTYPDVLVWLHENLTNNLTSLYKYKNLNGGVYRENN